MPFDFARDCWFLTGATASGKSGVAMELASALGAAGRPAEVLSLDSMAIYRGMDIGTAKPSRADQQRLPHHLIDLRDPDQEFSVAEYLEVAEGAVKQVLDRGATPLFVGGTPLYLKCLLRGLFDGPAADWTLREELEGELAAVGPAVLHERLTLVDPLAASNIHPNDARRIVRALEVYRSTGQPISHRQLEFDDARPAESCRVFVLQREPDDRRRRIEARVEAMMAEGLVEEVRNLTADGATLSRSASQAVGYREVIEHLAGAHDLPTTVERVQARTRRFAKRQGTWFRSLSECRFIEVAAEETPATIAGRIMAAGDPDRSE